MTGVAEWERAGFRFQWRGHEVFFRDEGKGEPILLIHGVPNASWVWHRLWPLLLPGHRLIAPDLLGFGLSDKPRHLVADVSAQADLCQALLHRCGVERYHIVAGDYGATVAQELLARGGAPAIASVCLTNGGIFPEAHRPTLGQRLITTRPGRYLSLLIARRPFGSSIARLFGPDTKPDRQTIDAIWELLMRNGGRRAMPAMMGYQDARVENRDRWVGALRAAQVPCRFVCGTADPVVGEEMRRLWREHVPGGDVVELPGIGHFPQLEAPEALAEAVTALHRRSLGR